MSTSQRGLLSNYLNINRFLLVFCFLVLHRIAISSFKDFQRSTLQQRPDTVLRKQLQKRHEDQLALPMNTPNQFLKMAVWGLSATLGAAALAVAQTAMNWAPEFLSQLFWDRVSIVLQCQSQTQMCIKPQSLFMSIMSLYSYLSWS